MVVLFQVLGNFVPLGDVIGCGIGVGNSIFDVIYKFIVLSMGVFSVIVSGLNEFILL